MFLCILKLTEGLAEPGVLDFGLDVLRLMSSFKTFLTTNLSCCLFVTLTNGLSDSKTLKKKKKNLRPGKDNRAGGLDLAQGLPIENQYSFAMVQADDTSF